MVDMAKLLFSRMVGRTVWIPSDLSNTICLIQIIRRNAGHGHDMKMTKTIDQNQQPE
jgi:hypothetical protein